MTAVFDQQNKKFKGLWGESHGFAISKERPLGGVQAEGAEFIQVLSFRHVGHSQKTFIIFLVFSKYIQDG